MNGEREREGGERVKVYVKRVLSNCFSEKIDFITIGYLLVTKFVSSPILFHDLSGFF